MKAGDHDGQEVPPWCEIHAATPADTDAIAGLRKLVEPNKGMLRGSAARPVYDALVERVAAPQNVSFEHGVVGGVPGWWVRPSFARPFEGLVHYHGGWFNFGSAQAFRHLVGHIAAAVGVEAFVPDYRLAPEHPFPAATDDARACYLGLVEVGFKRIALVGDSAGGGLALSTLAGLSAEDVPSPKAAVALSPVTDLSFAGSSWISRAAADPYFTLPQATELVDAYLAGRDPLDPLASPLFGDLSGLPPVRIHAGTEEMLFDDAYRYASRAYDAGVDVRLEVWEQMPHGFLTALGRFAAADAALASIAAFLRGRLDVPPI